MIFMDVSFLHCVKFLNFIINCVHFSILELLKSKSITLLKKISPAYKIKDGCFYLYKYCIKKQISAQQQMLSVFLFFGCVFAAVIYFSFSSIVSLKINNILFHDPKYFSGSSKHNSIVCFMWYAIIAFYMHSHSEFLLWLSTSACLVCTWWLKAS